jgi:hypothetical protein
MGKNKHRGPFEITAGELRVEGYQFVEETIEVDLSTLSWAEGSDGDAGVWLATLTAAAIASTIGLVLGIKAEAEVEGADSTELGIRSSFGTLGTIDLSTEGDVAQIWAGQSMPDLTLALDGGSDDDPTGGTLTLRVFGIKAG